MKKVISWVIGILAVGTVVVLLVTNNNNNNNDDDVITSSEGLEAESETVGDVNQKPVEGLEQGDVPPDFELTTFNGDTFKLSEMQGKKVILNFWASWCGPCKAEMPHMQNYYENFAEDDNVEILAVNMSTQERRGMDGVEEFIDSYGLTFPIPLDMEGEAIDDYKVMTIPTTYMLNTDGTLGQKIIGPMDEKTIQALVEQLN